MRSARIAVVACACTWAVHAEASLVGVETVPIGNPGNVGESSGISPGEPVVIVGGVDYVYEIGKYEVTAAQYTAFLNAVAVTDTYGLYNHNMWDSQYGCKIRRYGTQGSYTYTVAADWADRPVNYLSWYDSLRFANWMENGQPTIGYQCDATTEDGSYDLSQGAAVARKPGATWVIPTEDEWYKSAYHKNDGVTGNYWDYPTGTDVLPNNGNPEGDTGNTINYADPDFTIGAPYWKTEVGFLDLSVGPYGTFDQGGNVWEWNEALIGASRGVRGGSFIIGALNFRANYRHGYNPVSEGPDLGFRLVHVPEPSTLCLVLLSGFAFRRRHTPR